MSEPKPADRLSPNPLPPRHAPTQSQDSGFSAFADSTISNPDSLWLSRFPQPPTSIPISPTLGSFSIFRPNNNDPPPPLPVSPVRRLPVVPESASSTTRIVRPPPLSSINVLPHALSSLLTTDPKGAPNTTVSPHDWHEGASSIDVDATEDRLLSTSFITSLLRENTGPRIGQRDSLSSDAVSGISEMTYPPINYASTSRTPITRGLTPQKPQGARAPSSSYAPVIDRTSRASGGETATLYSYVSDGQPGKSVPNRDSKRGSIDGGSTNGVDHANRYSFAPRPVPVSIGESTLRADDTLHHQKLHHQGHISGWPRNGHVRQSTPSVRSTAPSIISRISSHKSVRRILAWTRIKPLPPVPLIPEMPISAERAHRREEEETPLPELLQRAGALQGLLEKGFYPHHSLTSYYQASKGEDLSSQSTGPRFTLAQSVRSTPTISPPRVAVNRAREWLNRRLVPSQKPTTVSDKLKHWFILLLPLLLLVVIVIGTTVGVTMGRKKSHGSSPNCLGNMTGASCNLDATCICTSGTPGQCNGLARSIVDLVQNLNDQFSLNTTAGDVYVSFWQAQGSPSGANCLRQVRLLDVGSNLDFNVSASKWAKTALLWNLVRSQDEDATEMIREFVVNAPWNKLATEPLAFSTTVSGYVFNFFSQTVNPPSQSFVTVGQPAREQVAKVNTLSRSSLDYMYGYAVASSTQQNTTLQKYWQSTLHRRPEDLPKFGTAFSVSPIILPFDADSDSISTLLSTNPMPTQFPPPLACSPGLDQVTRNKIDSVEQDIFHLGPVRQQSEFTTDCYPDHPVYGVLDVLQLRLPFSDNKKRLPKQGALLQRDTSPRAIIYTTEFLDSLPIASNGVNLTLQQRDPRRFGTLNHYDHVILDYLTSMSPTLANAVVDFVLQTITTTHVPPNQTNSILWQSLDTIPIIEVAVFGSVETSDIRSVVTSFTNETGLLFFGSDHGHALRQWTIVEAKSTLVWAESAISPTVVRDGNITDTVFNNIWGVASQAIKLGIPNPTTNLTQSLTAYGYFSP
ncbi:hypothetical protein AMATHDRAFT_185216 [Amanita thiersii Skay4041]|uniref:Uncharacterized protein n=1 Tax=Amanita thiersii Skay4041 TaxID=703135 RepID=A0A2A9NWM2_9AGAR|nr:hypothetical protein AMATHDRAFT_185216 [Amanita thiersii Skay4041]